MSFRGFARRAAFTVAVLTLVSSCSSPEAQGIRVPISGSNDTGTIYVLEDARFRIAGPTTITLAGNDTSGNVVSAGLPVGDYTVTLLSGWTLVRLPEGTPMIATVASPNPQSVTIMDGARVQVTFVFEVMGELVSMTGDGDLDIGFFVSEDATPGALDAGSLVDMDGDGIPVPDDCDDANPMVSPGAPEQCNGIDDDCDELIDEGCSGCMPSPELCNANDDDCDGLIDEGFMCQPGSTSACTTGCGSTGTRACDPSCTFSACMPPAETCNGVDDDCDATVDEGCSGCMPTVEVCNGLDDDCDLVVDEGVFGGACGDDTGECAAGMHVCVNGAFECVGGTGPSAEVCDGLDQDCDGAIDEGNPGGGAACGSGVGQCTQGAQMCLNGAFECVGSVGPSAEVCNGLDDDCDGLVDEGNPGGGAACGISTGECQLGSLSCLAGSLMCQGDVGPTAEVCNGLDDDCDGIVDNGC